jgi:hypothetical protein
MTMAHKRYGQKLQGEIDVVVGRPLTQLLPLLVVVGLRRILCRYRKESKLSIKSTYSTWSSALADQPFTRPTTSRYTL